METPPYKLGRLDRPFAHEGHFELQSGEGWSRLALAPKSGHVALLCDLLEVMSPPFGFLYVLVASVLGHDEGRYQTAEPDERLSMQAFLRDFERFFEQDGRHNVWLISLPDQSQLIYDRHQIIYAYGPLDKFRAIAEKHGLTEGFVEIPSPHTHNYNMQFHTEEDRLFATREWKHFPLEPGDDE